MRFQKEARVLKRQKSEMIRLGLAHLGLEEIPGDPVEARRMIRNLCKFLHASSPLDGVYTSEFDLLRSRMGVVYGELFASIAKWVPGYLIMRERDPYDDLVIVVSPDFSYCVSPIDLAILDSNGDPNYGFTILSMIEEGQLPLSTPGEFLNLVEFVDKQNSSGK